MVQNKITPKQLEILILLYRFRFLNRHHIQTFLNHKNHVRINAWLKDLTRRKIIGRRYSNTIGENNKPAIYYLNSQSHSILKNKSAIDKRILKRVYRERLRSKRLQNHYLLLANLYFLFLKQTKIDETLHFYTSTDLVKHTYIPLTRPDAYIALKSSNQAKRYFLDIIDHDTPRYALRQKIDSYFEYYDDDTWQQATGYQFPKILLVCPSQSLKYYLKKYLSQKLESELSDIEFYVSVSDSLLSSNSHGWSLVEFE